jgi:hypothetical protein
MSKSIGKISELSAQNNIQDREARMDLMIKECRDILVQIYWKDLNLSKQLNKSLFKHLFIDRIHTRNHYHRIAGTTQMLKHTYTNLKTDMITVCFKVTLDSTSCIYAYFHCECSESSIEYKYVCCGPTFKSQDGEYRGRVLIWEQFQDILKYYSNIIDQVETMVVSKISSGNMTYQTDFYYPVNVKCQIDRRKLEEFINVQRLPIKFYILCWLYDFHNIHNRIAENHINPAYQYIIYQPDDVPLYNSIYEQLQSEGIEKLQRNLSEYIYNLDTELTSNAGMHCGQKIFPLSAIEAVRLDDINFNVWREIYINNLASNLVLNLISPSFPFVNNWFYIQGSHDGLFDNLAMHDKFAHSKIAENISDRLRLVDKLNYQDENETIPITGKFFRLSKNIHKAIIYANSDIKLTDLSVCVTSEYVGRTLRDMPALMESKQKVPGLELVFTDLGIFTKHMFEFIYSFYCMNSKIGIIHGDLHMNNATIFRLYNLISLKGEYLVKNPHIVYLIEDELYCLPHIGMFSMIIDFSRSIIGDYDRIVNEFSERFAAMYFTEQQGRFLSIIHHYFPQLFENYQTQLVELLSENFSLVFKIMTAIDTYAIMSNISAMFKFDVTIAGGDLMIAKGAQNLLDRIIRYSEDLILGNILSAIDGKISVPDDIEWPNLLIIREIFSNFLITEDNLIKKTDDPNFNVIEIFNSNNEIKYEIEDHDTWGPVLSLDIEIQLRKKYDLPDPSFDEWLKFKDTDEIKDLDALSDKYREKEKEIMAMEDWMLQ